MLSYSERSIQKYIDYMEDLKDKEQIQIKMLSYSQRSIQKYIDYMDCVEPVFPIIKYVSVFTVFKNSNETILDYEKRIQDVVSCINKNIVCNMNFHIKGQISKWSKDIHILNEKITKYSQPPLLICDDIDDEHFTDIVIKTNEDSQYSTTTKDVEEIIDLINTNIDDDADLLKNIGYYDKNSGPYFGYNYKSSVKIAGLFPESDSKEYTLWMDKTDDANIQHFVNALFKDVDSRYINNMEIGYGFIVEEK